MKKVSVVGRWPLCATLVAGGLLMMMPQAQADWVKDSTEFTPDSKIVIHEDAFNTGTANDSHEATDPAPITSQSGIARGDAYTIRGSAGTNKLNGSAKTWFVWRTDPRSSNSQVPEKLSLLITASANATARDGSTRVATTTSATSTSTDPRSQPPQYYPHTPGNEKATASIGDKRSSGVVGSESTSAGVSIRKLVQVSTSGSPKVASPSFGFQANAELSNERADLFPGSSTYYKIPVSGTVHTAATFNAEIDTRSVTLSRGGATNEWQTIEDGIIVKHGDTIYSFTEHQSAQTPEYVPVKQVFQSVLSGNWPTKFYAPSSGGYDITWDWTASGGLEEYSNSLAPPGRQSDAASYKLWDKFSRVTEKGNLEAWYGLLGNTAPTYTKSGTPKSAKTATIKYFVRDNVDQAEAEARYELTIHEPIEIVSHDKKPVAPLKVNFPIFVKKDGSTYFRGVYAEDKNNPAAKGTITKNTGTATATTYGFSVGQQGGVDVAVIPTLVNINLSQTREFNWSKTYEDSEEVGAELTLPLLPNRGAYLAGQWLYQRYETKYRWYESSGEKRNSGSPALPEPSTPWEQTWDVRLNDDPTVYWQEVDFTKESLPDIPNSDNPVYRPSAPEL